MKRIFDIILAIVVIVILLIPIMFISLAVRCTSPGPVLYWSNRIGRHNKIFRMPKFRSMHLNAPVVATHLMPEPGIYLTPIGSFLRKTSLDEIPQVYSVLKGEMSFVGPRPALFNQKDLIELRNKLGIQELVPGLTGWAQVNGRDDLSISEKVALDAEYMKKKSFFFDFIILLKTFSRIARGDDVSH